MYARVIALPFDEWKAWYDQQAADLQAAEDAAAEGASSSRSSEGSGDASHRRGSPE